MPKTTVNEDDFLNFRMDAMPVVFGDVLAERVTKRTIPVRGIVKKVFVSSILFFFLAIFAAFVLEFVKNNKERLKKYL